MSELGQLDTYYRIVYDYLQPDRLLSCVEGVFLSVIGVSSHHHRSRRGDEDNDEDNFIAQSVEQSSSSSSSPLASGQLWCAATTVQSRVLLALILYFCLCLFFIHLAWLVYGQHINDLFVRSGIGQQQQQQPQKVNHDGNPVNPSPKHHTKSD